MTTKFQSTMQTLEPEDAAKAERRDFARREPRAPASFPVRVSGPTDVWTGFTRNISTGGLFIGLPQPLPIGEMLVVRFRLGSNPAEYQAVAEVRWVRTPDAASPDSPAGMGVRFIDLPPAVAAQIQAYIEGLSDSLFFDDTP